jgi:hypothetical protein
VLDRFVISASKGIGGKPALLSRESRSCHDHTTTQHPHRCDNNFAHYRNTTQTQRIATYLLWCAIIDKRRTMGT